MAYRREVHKKLKTHEKSLEHLWDKNRYTISHYRVGIIKKAIEENKKELSPDVLKEAKKATHRMVTIETLKEPIEHHDLDLSLFSLEYINKKKRSWESKVRKVFSFSPTNPRLWLYTEGSFLPKPRDKELEKSLINEIKEIKKELRPIAYLAAVTKHNYPLFKKYKGSKKLEKALTKLQRRMRELEGVPDFWPIGEDSSITMRKTAISTKRGRVKRIEEYPTEVRGIELFNLPDVEEAKKSHNETMKELKKHARGVSKIFFDDIKPALERYGKVELFSAGTEDSIRNIKDYKDLADSIEAEIHIDGWLLGKINVNTGKLILEGTTAQGFEIPELERLSKKYKVHRENPIAGRPLKLSQVYRALIKNKGRGR
ncbi:MAG: hypothetical protein J7L23_00840 [Candidatus Diapherotrites archaeon]|nr:hypothetical protein [Candidatus Diapherotrites archaeon]